MYNVVTGECVVFILKRTWEETVQYHAPYMQVQMPSHNHL